MSMDQESTGSPVSAAGFSSASGSSEGSNSGSQGSAANQQRRRRRRRKTNRQAGSPEVGAQGNGGNAGGDDSPVVSAAPVAAPVAASQEAAPVAEVRRENSGGREFRDRRENWGGQQGGGAKKKWQKHKNNGGGGTGQNHGQNNGGGGQQNFGSQASSPQGGGGGGYQGQNRPYNRGGGQQPREYNPGNSMYPPGQNRGGGGRKGKNDRGRRGPASFVGPMDHMYRGVNGNVADPTPSTMDWRNGGNQNVNGNVSGRNGYYDEFDAYQQPVAVREDAPTRIVCFVEELFLVAKMQETARKLGIKVGFAKGSEKDQVAAIMDAAETDRPTLLVFDLNNANAKPLTLIPKFKAKFKRSASIIGFLSQIQGDLKAKAVEAGCDMVVPKSTFSQNLPNLLRRHGLDEELEAVEA